MPCAQQPIPEGWNVWRQPVPAELAQIAVVIRDRIRQFPRGSIAQIVDYNGQTVGFWVSNHTWTYQRQADGSMQLVTGICIPGVSLIYRPQAQQASLTQAVGDDLSAPDPNAAVFWAEAATESKPLLGAGVGGALGLFLGGLPGALIGAALGGLYSYFQSK
jgi:hypothetical protein